MSAIATEFQGPFWAHLVTALAHSLWIGALVSLLLYAILRRIPAWRADLRYGVCIAGLGLVVFGTLCAWAAVSYEWPEAEEQAVQATLAPEAVSELSPNTTLSTAKPVGLPPAPRPTSSPWTAWLAPIWLLGAGMALGRALTMLSGAGRLRRQCRPVTDESLLAVMDELRLALGITREVAVLVGDHIVGPVVTGALYPAILLPVSVVTGLPMDHVRAILAHELAHVRRHDYLFSVGQTLIESLLFFNPAVWWIGRRIRVEREACCDAYAAAMVGDGAAYAHVLATVADHLHGARLSLNPAMGGDEGSTGLVDRVRRLVRPEHRPHLRVPWYALAGVTVAVAGVLGA
ncbi:MAG: M56 family metallopeptidase, partial [bacterium]|nr:M56 family metallopeptidase [bacterium]